MHNVIFTEKPTIEVIYQDEYLVAINKPAGLLVHRSPIDNKELFFAVQETRKLLGKIVFPLHRLDKPTSGVLLFALSSDVARIMSNKFLLHDIHKEYVACVRGFTPEQTVIDYPLKRILDKIADKHKQPVQESQTALTQLTTLKQVELPFPSGRYASTRYSLVKLSPKTGRKHQLRRHLAHIRHPIIGDTSHGDNKQNRAAKEMLNVTRLLLHAQKLSFKHPVENKNISIIADYDDAFNRVLTIFNSKDMTN